MTKKYIITVLAVAVCFCAGIAATARGLDNMTLDGSSSLLSLYHHEVVVGLRTLGSLNHFCMNNIELLIHDVYPWLESMKHTAFTQGQKIITQVSQLKSR